jgi:tRNA-2-methylthio-N6-dimethylallyladenosine synthase
MTERIVRAVADLPNVCGHFNIPVQAADNEVLARMRRGYTIEEYAQWVDRIRDVVPDASLSTDVIVGFCGETNSQFQRTLDLLENIRFDKVHVAVYSPRPGTFASRRLEDDVPHEEKMRRLHAVEVLQERIATEINQALIDTTQEVLVEDLPTDRRGENARVGAHGHAPVLTGRTRGNKLVHWPRPSGPDEAALGDLVNVRITRASPWALRGAQAEAVVPA